MTVSNVLSVLCLSTDSTISMSEKVYAVVGVIHKARGMDAGGEPVYCKIRLEL